MDTSKCQALLTVLEKGNLAHAAEELGYTTSGISRMMSSLEGEVGFPLLVRSKTGVRPTPDCTRMLPTFTQLASLGESCEEQASLIRGVEVGRVRVGCAYRPFYKPIAELLTEFSQAHPTVEVDFTARNSTPLVRQIERGALDLAVISHREGDVTWTTLLEDPMVALVPADHPLAEADSYPIRGFAQDPFIMLYPDEESDNSRTLATHGIQPNSHNTVLELRDAFELVSVGLGVTMINNIYADVPDDRVRVLPIRPAVNVPIGVATPAPGLASPAARAFAEFAMPRLSRVAHDLAGHKSRG
ncbi:MAG: LysR family transcriptional regulator [Olegusella sp.]|nr:LysR family transcriptional regulator [Olegusella sp.]